MRLKTKNIADNLTLRETNPKYYFVDNGIISLLILTNEEESRITISNKTIEIIPVWKWLVEQ